MARQHNEVIIILQAWGQRVAMADDLPCVSAQPLDGGASSHPASRIPQGIPSSYSPLFLGDVPVALIEDCIARLPVEQRNVAVQHYVRDTGQRGMPRSTYYDRLARVHQAVGEWLAAWRAMPCDRPPVRD